MKFSYFLLVVLVVAFSGCDQVEEYSPQTNEPTPEALADAINDNYPAQEGATIAIAPTFPDKTETVTWLQTGGIDVSYIATSRVLTITHVPWVDQDEELHFDVKADYRDGSSDVASFKVTIPNEPLAELSTTTPVTELTAG